ncbi:MAG: CoA transferase [Pseudomonadales bacterium]|nr:CoA transferase [Pseudomonadales bacterium]
MTQAFNGVRIIDFTQVLAGPMGVMQLALLGADVIKVEQVGSGDQTRGLMTTNSDGMSPSFMTCNLNKRSITLDLKSEAAQQIVPRLVESADVLVENFKAGTMDRMGFGYEAMSAINPGLIYCSVTGYGQTGAKAGVAAYDGAIQASSGMMSQNGHPATGPTRTGYMPVDMSTALNTAFAISAALYRKLATGKGQRLDVAMMDTAIVAQAAQYSNFMNAGTLVGLRGNASPTGQPTADVFPTADGYIQITALRDNQVLTLFTAMNCAEQLQQPGFDSVEARLNNPDVVREFVSEQLRLAPTSHWMQALGSAGVPVAEIRELAEVIEDPQFEGRNVFETLPSPTGAGEDIRVVKAGYVTNEDGPAVRSGPPVLGTHTNEVLAELGFASETIADWRTSGSI